jgi:hypothetical protein
MFGDVVAQWLSPLAGSLLDGTCSLSDTQLESGVEQLCAINELINELNINTF